MVSRSVLEFVFFDPRPRDQFLARLDKMGVESDCRQQGEELFVLVSEDLADELLERIEWCYEATFDLAEQLMAEAEGVEHFSVAGVEVHLKEGPVIASVDARLLQKILSVLDFDELGCFVDAIAKAVEEPDRRPLCKR